jgi:hypothetical protein
LAATIISKYQPRCRLLNPSSSCLLRWINCAVPFFLSIPLHCVASCPSRIPFSALGRVLSFCARQSQPQWTAFWSQLLYCVSFTLQWPVLRLTPSLAEKHLARGVAGEGGGVGDWCGRPGSRVQEPAKWIFCTKKNCAQNFELLR